MGATLKDKLISCIHDDTELTCVYHGFESNQSDNYFLSMLWGYLELEEQSKFISECEAHDHGDSAFQLSARINFNDGKLIIRHIQFTPED